MVSVRAREAFERGIEHHRRGDLALAISCYDEAISLEAGLAGAYSNKSVALKGLGDREAALLNCKKAITCSPNVAEYHYNCGGLLRELGAFDQALESYDRAIALKPHYPDAINNRGSVLKDVLRIDEAVREYDAALRQDPDHATARYNRISCALLLGDFTHGFRALFDHRFIDSPYEKAYPDKSLLKIGSVERLRGARVLIYGSLAVHHGYGDMIQFCRFTGALEDADAVVSLAADRPIMRLLQSIDRKVEVIEYGLPQSEGAFDYHAPVLGLPTVFDITPERIPGRTPYLHAEPDRVARWRATIGDGGFRIGICWQGSTRGDDVGRSFPLAELAPVAALPNVRLISLHKGVGVSQLDALPHGMQVETLGDDFDEGACGFIDSAAVMQHCDLVLTSDTAIAHLGGALGVPTWVALKHSPEWRWMLDRQDSPWYPSMRLFRQKAPGDWAGLFAEVEAALRQKMAGLAPA